MGGPDRLHAGTGFYVVGCLVFAGSFWRTSRPGAPAAAGPFMLAAVWLLRVSQVRAG